MAGRPEFCAVCNEQAIGFHYDVPSCSGCRSFFRRTIKQEKDYTCKREGKCMKENDQERSNCKACRLDSCIEAGMNPLALQSSDIDIPSNKLAQRIVARQATKRATALALVRPSSTPTVEDRVQGLIDQLVLTQQAHDRLRASMFSPSPFDGYDLEKAFRDTSVIGQQWGDMREPENMEIMKACKPPKKVMEGRLKWWPLADAVYTVEYMRTFPFFNQLSRQDQRLLAIYSVSTVTNLTRSYFSVRQRSEVMVNPDGMRHNGQWETVADLDYDCEVIMQLYRLGVTENEYSLLKAIVATDYDILGFSAEGQQVLARQQAIYRKALLSLVFTTRGPIEGPRFFAATLLMTGTLKKVTLKKKVEHKQFYPVYRNTPYACPIIEEILYEDPLLP